MIIFIQFFLAKNLFRRIRWSLKLLNDQVGFCASGFSISPPVQLNSFLCRAILSMLSTNEGQYDIILLDSPFSKY